jgi:hypothetical protein
VNDDGRILDGVETIFLEGAWPGNVNDNAMSEGSGDRRKEWVKLSQTKSLFILIESMKFHNLLFPCEEYNECLSCFLFKSTFVFIGNESLCNMCALLNCDV